MWGLLGRCLQSRLPTMTLRQSQCPKAGTPVRRSHDGEGGMPALMRAHSHYPLPRAAGIYKRLNKEVSVWIS